MKCIELRSLERFRQKCYGWLRTEYEAMITPFYVEFRWMWE